MNNKAILFVLGFIVILALGWLYFPVLTKYRNLKTEEEKIEDQIEDLDQKIAKLRSEKKLLESDSKYIEKVVRDELGLVKPGEVVYKFVEDYSLAPDGTPVEQPSARPAYLPTNDGRLLDISPSDSVVTSPKKDSSRGLENQPYYASSHT